MHPRVLFSRPALLLGLLALLSAFLLFQVQPMISKFILPWFGGSPGVWTTCMLFFQVVLFGGYAYAHGLTRLPHRWQWLVHALVILAAAVVLPVAPNPAWKPTGNEDPMWRILLLLSTSVGLPYFALSSTGPLVQVWFSRASGGGAPWRLYALSNLGSLAALISYPFFFEVKWDVLEQTRLWSAAFVLFAVLSAGFAWRDRKVAAGQEEEANPSHASPPVVQAPTWWRRILWLVLPALASVLLLATTNHVCQDVAVVPFLWVIPLSLYLLTFIICFEHERWYRQLLWSLVAVPAVLLAAGYPELDWNWSNTIKLAGGKSFTLPWEWALTFKRELVICFSAMFFGCMMCHGELVRLKPAPKYLTEFYLWMSAGGAMGGLLVSLAAPHVFSTYLEWPIALMAVFVVAVVPFIRVAITKPPRLCRFVLPVPILAVTVTGLYLMQDWGFELPLRRERVRNFYGSISVEEEWDEENHFWRTLHHGGIVHGLQRFGDDHEEPYSYYAHETGIGRALDSLAKKPDARVGIVGMGTATVAAYGKAGHLFRFYEINPEMVRLARTHFIYLEDMEKRGGKVEVVIGDARLSLEREESQQFDVLLLDAFSGDSVPVHLLTREAFEIYRRHMRPDGIIAVHCSNRYLALASPVQKIAGEMGYGTTRVGTDADGDDYNITDYLLLTNNQAFLDANPTESPFREVMLDVPAWTDKRHNLFEILEKE